MPGGGYPTRMRLAHVQGAVDALRAPTCETPWRVLVSGCMLGMACGVDGTDYGMGGTLGAFFAQPGVCALGFCPEDSGLGTPRGMPDLHGGDGRDVLAGTARVLDEHGHDMTAGMLAGGRAMVRFARAERVDFAILTDMSAACGTQVVSDGCRFDEERKYRKGLGVAAALLVEAGIPVVSPRDERTIEALWRRLDPTRPPAPAAKDHHEGAWYQTYFGPPQGESPRPSSGSSAS